MNRPAGERAEDADVVFFGLNLSVENDREVLVSLRTHFEDTPVVVEIPAPSIPRSRDELEGWHVVPQPLTRKTLLQAIDQALR